jgi:hypothetical protein
VPSRNPPKPPPKPRSGSRIQKPGVVTPGRTAPTLPNPGRVRNRPCPFPLPLRSHTRHHPNARQQPDNPPPKSPQPPIPSRTDLAEAKPRAHPAPDGNDVAACKRLDLRHPDGPKEGHGEQRGGRGDPKTAEGHQGKCAIRERSAGLRLLPNSLNRVAKDSRHHGKGDRLANPHLRPKHASRRRNRKGHQPRSRATPTTTTPAAPARSPGSPDYDIHHPTSFLTSSHIRSSNPVLPEWYPEAKGPPGPLEGPSSNS